VAPHASGEGEQARPGAGVRRDARRRSARAGCTHEKRRPGAQALRLTTAPTTRPSGIGSVAVRLAPRACADADADADGTKDAQALNFRLELVAKYRSFRCRFRPRRRAFFVTTPM